MSYVCLSETTFGSDLQERIFGPFAHFFSLLWDFCHKFQCGEETSNTNPKQTPGPFLASSEQR